MPTDRNNCRVAVVTPAYRPGLTPAEELSLDRALTVLAPHDHFLAVPRGLDVTAYREKFRRRGKEARLASFAPVFFQSLEGYSRLLTSLRFYRRFARYDFVLIYQLDCYVFRDELLDWCAKGCDYIGAPWFKGHKDAGPDAPFDGVGNGGFSLRSVRAARRALLRFYAARAWYATAGRLFRSYRPQEWDLHVRENEDRFWGQALGPRVPGFRLPTAEEAIPFAFEVNPARLYRLNGERLPFGCHAWGRYDPAFWSQFIPGKE